MCQCQCQCESTTPGCCSARERVAGAQCVAASSRLHMDRDGPSSASCCAPACLRMAALLLGPHDECSMYSGGRRRRHFSPLPMPMCGHGQSAARFSHEGRPSSATPTYLTRHSADQVSAPTRASRDLTCHCTTSAPKRPLACGGHWRSLMAARGLQRAAPCVQPMQPFIRQSWALRNMGARTECRMVPLPALPITTVWMPHRVATLHATALTRNAPRFWLHLGLPLRYLLTPLPIFTSIFRLLLALPCPTLPPALSFRPDIAFR